MERGFVLTSMDQIAARAGVSRPTVFALGTKTALLAQLRDRALDAGDERALVEERSWFRELSGASEPGDVLRRYADRIARTAGRQLQLGEVLHQAAAVHEDLRELWWTTEEQRYAEATAVADLIVARGHGRHDRETSRDLLWALTSGQHHQTLVRLRGWSHERYRQWLRETLCELLLVVARQPAEGPPRRRFRRGAG